MKSSSDAVVSCEPPSNGNIAVSNGAKTGIGADLLESKTGTLTTEPSSDHHRGGGVAERSIDDARVSGDERGIVMEHVEKVLDEDGADDEEKEGEYKVSDLVWAKVKSYPWWPGQIFDPSASTDKARKYSKKNGFLIAYFGDQTFAWNEASKIKPFRKNFCKMEKQSNSKAFCHAVNCALDEVSRRLEFGLACPCLSVEEYSKLKSQVFVNAGIREEASRIDGGDSFSTVATFKPANVVRSVQHLAKEHFGGISRLEVSSVRAQLSAFYRWKGYYQSPLRPFSDEPDDKVEDHSELPLTREEKVVEDAKPTSVGEKVLSKKRKLNARDSVSRKHQHVGNDDMIPSKEERWSTHLVPNGSSSVNREDKNKKDDGKRTAVESHGLKEESQNGGADGKSSISSSKSLFRVGDSICRIARQLTESPLILKKEPQRSKKPLVYPPTDEILSQICLAATNPMEKHILNYSARFSSDFRNFIVEKNSQMREKNSIHEKLVEEIEENACRPDVTEAGGHKDTDSVIPSNPDEQLFSESKSLTIDSSPKTSKENSATALILKFTNLDSIPSVMNLNEIFSRYGPVREMETEVFKKNNCAKVVFEARSNAETAFSSAGKFGIFGPSLIGYRLDYAPVLRKTPTSCTNQDQKG